MNEKLVKLSQEIKEEMFAASTSQDAMRRLHELGMQLKAMLLETVEHKDVSLARHIFFEFMELSRQQENTGIQLETFDEGIRNEWIISMDQELERAFEPGTPADEEELLDEISCALGNSDESQRMLGAFASHLKEHPELVEHEDSEALISIGASIRQSFETAVLSRDRELVFAIFSRVERDRHWWRAIFHEPGFNAWWQREVNY